MNESLLLLRKYVRMVWCYRWIALVTAALICAGGWVVVLGMPDRYQVTTKVFLDTSTILKPLLKGIALDSNTREDTVRMVQRTLLSRPNIEAVARKTDLDLKAHGPDEFEELLKRLQSNIQVTGTYRDNIFDISYTNTDPKLAARVVQALLNIFMEKSLGESRKDTSNSKQFLDQQIHDYKTKLETAEERLKEFKQKNVGLMPGEGQSYYSQLQAASAELAQAKLQLEEATKRRDELHKQVQGEAPSFGFDSSSPSLSSPAGPSSETATLDERIAAMESRLDQLLLQYTEQHPDVIATRRVLRDLKRQRKEKLEKLAEARKAAPAATSPAGSAPAPLVENPVYQQMKVALGQADAEVAALQARVEEYERRKENLAKLVNTVPEIEAELTRLNRNYRIYKANYDELVQRREALKLSDQASQTTDAVQFNIVEPPRVPTLPAGPDRPRLNAIILVLGLAAGVGLAWLVAMVRSGVYTKDDFQEISDLPVLGVVSRIWTPGMLFKRRLEVASFALGCLCLLGLFGGIYTLGALDIDVASRLEGFGIPLAHLERLLQ
jgi:polysaccharide chain length determinant protein (PEP-CTERM system associated)